jgi:hypothetical protein
VIQTISEFVPATPQNEDKVGYTVYHLGAVLLRNDFEVFEWMRKTRNSMCKMMDDCLVKCLEKTTRDHNLITFQNYIRQIQTFCDALAEIDLYQVMVKVFKLFYRRDIAPPNVSYDLSGQFVGASDMSLELRGILSPTPGQKRILAIVMAQEGLGLYVRQSGRAKFSSRSKARASLPLMPLTKSPRPVFSPGQQRASMSVMLLNRPSSSIRDSKGWASLSNLPLVNGSLSLVPRLHNFHLDKQGQSYHHYH